MNNTDAMKKLRDSFRNHWLMLLIMLQPILDILAYWTKSPDGTAAGVIRLAIMLLLPLYLLLTLKDKKRFIISMAVIAGVCALHLLNGLRVGQVSLAFDVAYAAKTAQMPIMAVCLTYCIKNEQTRNQAYWGLFFAAAITAVSIGLAVLTGTDNCTYGAGLGISGWVIDDNRCANSIILVTLAAFACFCAVKSERPAVNVGVPMAVWLVLISNGTKACFYSIFVIFVGFAAFLAAETKVNGTRFKRLVSVTMLLLAILTVIVYPYTPRCKVSAAQAKGAEDIRNEIELTLDALGYDLSSMTNEEKLNDPVVHQVFEDYYRKCIWHILPNMFDRFTVDEILLKYKLTTSPETLIDTRVMKTAYASLLWDKCDTLTRLVGFDVSDIWYTGGCDLENDWPAIFFYYGYIGAAAYGGFVLYFIYLIIIRLRRNFKTAFTADNFILLMTLLLFIGLAQFSGSALRRPNVSIYMSVVLGLIYYQTVIKPDSEGNSLWGIRNET